VAQVSALDYSPAMIDLLRADAAARGLGNVEARVGDHRRDARLARRRAGRLIGAGFLQEVVQRLQDRLRVRATRPALPPPLTEAAGPRSWRSGRDPGGSGRLAVRVRRRWQW
jgi:hypothetical protein